MSKEITIGEALKIAVNANVSKKLSKAQQRFMTQLEKNGESNPPWGYSKAGRDASAWHRTAQSLQDLGLVKVLHEGHGFRAVKA